MSAQAAKESNSGTENCLSSSPADPKQTMLRTGRLVCDTAGAQRNNEQRLSPAHVPLGCQPFAPAMPETDITLSPEQVKKRLSKAQLASAIPKRRVGSTRENRNLTGTLSAWLGGAQGARGAAEPRCIR